MESISDPRALSTSQRGETMTQNKHEVGNVVHDSLASFRRIRRSETHRKRRREVKVLKEGSGCENEEEAEVERKIMALQRLVPGGESLGVEKLFEETAGYILALQGQVKAMKVLANCLERFEREKNKFGG